MASLKYFLLCPFVFLCLSCTIANRVLTSEDGPSFGFGLGLGVGSESRAELGGVSGVVAGIRAGLGVEGGQSNVGASPKVGFGLGVGVGPKPRAEGGVSSVGAGLGVEGGLRNAGEGGSVRSGDDPITNGIGAGPGFGPWSGYWPDPKNGGLYGNDCILGYVCPGNERSGCNKFAYETCDSYGFRPLTAAKDMHEVKINWAKSKPLASAQNGLSDNAQPTKKAQNGD